MIITCYWRWLIRAKIRSEAITTKEKEIKQKREKEEDKIERRLTKANQEWCNCKLQIHWNKLGWVNPRIRDERKIHFVSLQNNMF